MPRPRLSPRAPARGADARAGDGRRRRERRRGGGGGGAVARSCATRKTSTSARSCASSRSQRDAQEDGGAGRAAAATAPTTSEPPPAPPRSRRKSARRGAVRADVARLTTRGEARGDLSVSDDATYRAFLKEVGVEAAPSSVRATTTPEGAASASAADRRKTYVGATARERTHRRADVSPFGVIEKVEVVLDRDTNAPCRGFAFVLFAEESAARAARRTSPSRVSVPASPAAGVRRADRAMDVRVGRPETSSKNAERGFPKRETFLGKRIAEGPAVSPAQRKLAPTLSARRGNRASPRA